MPIIETIGINGTDYDLSDKNAKIPSSVRQALYTLLANAAYATTGLTDELAEVEAWAEEVTSLSITPTTLSLSGNTPQTITPTVAPSGSTVSWESSDTSVATVNDGVVTGVGNGTCTITASAGNLTATCAVSVSGFATLESISAVYTQSGTVYRNTPLDDLKSDLVVTATYSDTSTSTVASADYTLSGTLTVGTSTITVTYSGKTTTFTVTVSEQGLPTGYTAYDYVKQDTTPNASTRYKGIVTDLQLSSDYIIETKLYVPQHNSSNAACIWGTRNGNTGTKELALYFTPSNGKVSYWINNTDTTNTFYAPRDQVNTIRFLPVGQSETYPTKYVISINGTDYDTGSTVQGVTFEAWFGLFFYAISSTSIGTNDNRSAGEQIGQIIVKDTNDNLIYDLRPCKDTNNHIGFYEMVTEKFFYDSDNPDFYIGGNWE